MNARALAVTMLLLAGPVVAATPFGGADTGFIPPSKGVFVCASKTQQLAGKLVVGYTKCHIRLAAAGLAGNASGSAEEGCAQASRAKFDHAVGNVLGTGCPFCVVDHVNFHPIAATIEADLDAANGSVFCAGTTPLGDDDTGFVPPDDGVQVRGRGREGPRGAPLLPREVPHEVREVGDGRSAHRRGGVRIDRPRALVPGPVQSGARPGGRHLPGLPRCDSTGCARDRGRSGRRPDERHVLLRLAERRVRRAIATDDGHASTAPGSGRRGRDARPVAPRLEPFVLGGLPPDRRRCQK